jgi:cystathionine gamma-lyase
MRFATRAVHVGQDPDAMTGATIPPIYLTSTYTQHAPGKHKGFEYSRTRNPTRDALQACLTALEEGADAASFASGLAATDALITALLRPGQSLVAYGDMYGGTFRLLDKVFKPWGLEPRYTFDTDPSAIASLVDRTTRMVWIETPTNPMLRLLDIEAIALKVRDAERKFGGGPIHFVVDNTFATPALQQPLTLGADVVVHSTTKYLGGHSDIVGGALITKSAEIIEPIKFHQNAAGAVSSPFDCYLTQRGVKTLDLRMKRHCDNAQRVAAWAAEQGAFEQVIYPGLPAHPDHALARRQMRGFGGMVTVVLAGGLDAASCFMSALKVFACAESLGGVESLANHPAIMTHASVPRERREQLGIVDGLVRLSVGIEDADDLIEDLEQALRQIRS